MHGGHRGDEHERNGEEQDAQDEGAPNPRVMADVGTTVLSVAFAGATATTVGGRCHRNTPCILSSGAIQPYLKPGIPRSNYKGTPERRIYEGYGQGSTYIIRCVIYLRCVKA